MVKIEKKKLNWNIIIIYASLKLIYCFIFSAVLAFLLDWAEIIKFNWRVPAVFLFVIVSLWVYNAQK